MTFAKFAKDENGVTAVEFALTAPVFLMGLLGLFQAALWLWTQVGLQHGAEMAARCAGVNTTLCGTQSAIQQYAAGQAYGLKVAPSTFSVTQTTCGNQVSASYAFPNFAPYFNLPTVTIRASSCFPI